MKRTLLLALLAVLIAAGCTHYWERPGELMADFERESAACIQDARESPYGPDILEPIYRACMRDKGRKRIEASVARTNQLQGPEDAKEFLNPPSPLSGRRYDQDK